jgi:hypothetical protein
MSCARGCYSPRAGNAHAFECSSPLDGRTYGLHWMRLQRMWISGGLYQEQIVGILIAQVASSFY